VTSPFGLSLVFLNVLCDQLGLPVPAVPTLIVAGAMAADGRLPAGAVFSLALSACLLGDGVWYLAGRLFGGRVMTLLCRISLTPDSCVNQTQTSFERWGSKVLLVAKFIPGLALVAPPLAGATRMGVIRFFTYSALGGALWVGVALLGGMLLRAQIEPLLPRLAGLGGTAVALLLLVLAVYVAYKWWERDRFNRALNMARISVAELHEQLRHDAPPPVVLDVRSATAQGLQRQRIPGALHVPVQDVARQLGALPHDRDIILYCTCPNEASAATAARLLMTRGYRRVRPLHGGLDAWIAAGYAVEEITVPGSGAASAAQAPASPASRLS
jgi:membrane protein DedA with SNARE-associated domain/rhodanese-related sulfurtransferase